MRYADIYKEATRPFTNHPVCAEERDLFIEAQPPPLKTEGNELASTTVIDFKIAWVGQSPEIDGYAHTSTHFATCGTGLCLALLLAIAVSVSQTAQKPAFEVASIRFSPNQSTGREGLLYTIPDGQLSAREMRLRGLIFEAYDLKAADELLAGPDWIDSIRWDLDAEAGGNVP